MSLTGIRASAQSDSLVLSYDDYITNILLYHPVAQKAKLKPSYAEAALMKAKGSTDPTLDADWDKKNLNDKLYYEKFQSRLRFPTSTGVTIVGGYENTKGDYLNPENTTDEYGLWHLGIEINVLNGLLVNERNTAIRQAKEFQNLSLNEQNTLLNDLLYNAMYTYHTWQLYHSFMDVLSENITIAYDYYTNTRESYLQGEKTSMDTLEAHILYQEAISLFNKNEIYLIKSRQSVENYLWYNNEALTLQSNTLPEHYRELYRHQVVRYDSALIHNHPAIQASINKLSITEIEQRLKREKLKPKLKVKYNPLLTTSDNMAIHSFDIANYKIGVGFSMPLLLRSERAEVKMGKLKLQELQLDLNYKQNELLNKAEASWLQQSVLQQQIDINETNAINYKQLMDGEAEKFKYGESSVFMLNKRQEKYIGSRLKLAEAYIKYQLELLNYLYYSNQLISDESLTSLP
ncbi:TolC family protein [Carboxylicivirga mesophila]|uniref:TolC family protein n=1 Tax=Carboxylicivirga mesophila TaxID=1166478 RepID=A0ABS5KBM2_9BACT|nr:TolC family protein [Carboxylicivirga mesophila]MBS2211743.1 TolC family protein [Carboxylicivirga mesophila]